MRTLFALLLAHAYSTIPALCQPPRQAGLVRGVVVANKPGDLVVQSWADLSYHYRTDSHTWIEREQARIRVSDLQPGELLEVVSDCDPQLVRYARLVHVIPKAAPRAAKLSTGGVYRLPQGTAPDASLLTYSGLVSSRDEQRLTVRTRFDGEIAIYLRDDTHLLADGQEARAADLQINTHVFIRAAKNRDHVMEAFEVVWGQMLKPRD